MPSNPCTTCPKTFTTAHGLGKHAKTCAGRIPVIQQSLNKRKAMREEAEDDRKRARMWEGYVPEPEIEIPVVEPPSPPARRSGRPGRGIKVPSKWKDYLPSSKRALPSQFADAIPRDPSPPPPASPAHSATPSLPDDDALGAAADVPRAELYDTPADGFGIFRSYRSLPVVDPCQGTTLDEVSDIPVEAPSSGELPKSVRWLDRSDEDAKEHPWGPCDNETSFSLAEWFNNASNGKSLEDFDALLNVVKSDSFKPEDVKPLTARGLMKKLDDYTATSGIFSARDGWREGSVDIALPKPGTKYASEADAPHFKVHGLHFRKLLEVLVGEVQDRRFASKRNWIPFETYWLPPPDPAAPPGMPPVPPIRVFSDTFDTNEMNRLEAEIKRRPRNPEDPPDLEYAILPVCIWSDATCLATFGSASLWPIYLYVANVNKYIRGKPTEFVAQHLAYLPSLPDALQDFYRAHYKQAPSAETLCWCKCELMQQIWLQLLDTDFMEVYEHGIVLECGDGILRRLFPRLLTYSADYPEKVLLTAIKNLGKCPCPRCLVTKDQISQAGTKPDLRRRHTLKRVDNAALRTSVQKTRDWLFTKGYKVTSQRLKRVLDSKSLTPMQSAFSVRLSEVDPNFNFYQMMRQMPTFGRDKIRRFWHNVSRQNKLAARDYEDFLITAMPAFEGLLPLRDNQTIADLLFELVNWYALAKLRLHTQVTVDIFRAATKHMYAAVRHFARTTCEGHITHELAKEADARARRQGAQPGSKRTGKTRTQPRVVKFGTWKTYKYHVLGDCPDYVESAGPLETTSTKMGELEHRHAKRVYARTNKHGFAVQIAKHQRRQAVLRRIRERVTAAASAAGAATTSSAASKRARRPNLAKRCRAARRPKEDLAVCGETDFKGASDPAARYELGESDGERVNIYNWAAKNNDDPALEDYIPRLHAHILRRIFEDHDLPFSLNLLANLTIDGDSLYQHRVIRFNYTTYDMRRDQDSVNPRTHADVMLLARDRADGAHPYWYARVVGILHAYVRYTGPGAHSRWKTWQRLEMLWVRWYEFDTTYASGFQERRIPRLRFVDAHDKDAVAFDFIDPADVLRGTYIIPSFDGGLTTDYLDYAGSVGRHESHPDEDYRYYFVGMHVDRDMYMRYLGGGVGHRGIGVTVEESRRASARNEQKRASRRVAASASGGDSGTEGAQADLPSGSSSDSDDEDLPWRAKEGAREGDDDEDAAWGGAPPSDSENAMDAQSGGGNSAAGSDAEGGDGSEEDEPGDATEEDDDGWKFDAGAASDGYDSTGPPGSDEEGEYGDEEEDSDSDLEYEYGRS
ncbi:hypothetical protein TRAPUB_13472 [Trametes pubescens]|uniref:C2H2-type domain-containing protein n=1 Tax=Trametes pubescens TaxID=154538 RepID=A0A1M2VR38_TRAPU|nr:hypothetical protein TRAPUB_7270 [Trametes pubescens]OJT10027.1 hypothetical protein TRAPUB_13491 [Trametes pubescens]OJT10028.1 hypothetical protein TRAPUB_13480 [Trametes pubescens]OJT10038.1 hypothetical protein TRAPUB_13472 [Trametes pubescens]